MFETMATIPTAWIENYVRTFESGRMQKHAQARFVNAAGECCIVGALAGARSVEEFVASPLYACFVGTGLERLSRRFESRQLTSQEFYEEALLALVARRAAASAPEPAAV